MCDKGVCKCGNIGSCAGLTTGEFCDAANSECRCSQAVASCAGPVGTDQLCHAGTCKCTASLTCAGVTSGSYCDAAANSGNGACKCSQTVDSCAGPAGTDQLCHGGTCKCTSSLTCAGEATGSYCDSGNGVCKCSAIAAACATGQICSNRMCPGKFLKYSS